MPLTDFRLPEFRPHTLLRGGHAQTVGAVAFPGRLPEYRAQQHVVELADGDRIVLHDDCPASWTPGDRTVLLVHGLGGCHRSAYMQRIAHKLAARGVRAFRMDLRGCGAGVALARLPYHSGRSEDAAAALEFMAALCPRSPSTIVGFSLGANLTLKLLGECGSDPPGNLDSGMAISPPVELAACSEWLRRPLNRFYDAYFARLLTSRLAERRQVAPHAEHVEFARRPRRILDIDDAFTAPVCGFGVAANYYRVCSAARVSADVRLPTLVIAASDDPLIPMRLFHEVQFSSSTIVHVTRGGGHLGYIAARRGQDADRRWMDWRVVDWVTAIDARAAGAAIPDAATLRV